jgi:hypothetical protein
MKPRSSATSIYAAAAGLLLLALVGVVVTLLAMADVPRSSSFLLIGATAASMISSMALAALLVITNTRRPFGIDPNLTPDILDRRVQGLDDVPEDEQLVPQRVRVDWNQPGKRRTDLPLSVIHQVLDGIERQATEAGSGIDMDIELPAWVQDKLRSDEAQAELHGEGQVRVAHDQEP